MGVELEPRLDIWVEPVSGRLVNYQDQTTAYYYDLSTGERLHPWNKFSNQMSINSVQANVSAATFEKARIIVLEQYIPILLLFSALLTLWVQPKVRRYLKKLIPASLAQRVAAGFVILLASVILLLWLTDLDALQRYSLDGQSIMNPLTAVCFVLVGLLLIVRKKASKAAYMLVGMSLLVLNSLRIAAIYNLIDLQIDQVLFTDAVIQLNSRMSLFTATSFYLLGLAFIVYSVRSLRKLRIVEIMVITVIMLSSLAVLGYLFEPLQITILPFFAFTSASTAILMIIASSTARTILSPKKGVSLPFLSNTFVFGMLLISILFTVLFAGTVERSNLNESRVNFNLEAERIATAITDRVNFYVSALDGASGLFAASDEVTREEWSKYIQALSIQENYPGTQGIGFAEIVPAAELEQHIFRIREEGFTDYEVFPGGDREVYVPVIFMEPFDERNREAFGFDMLSEATRRTAIRQADSSSAPRMSGKVTLVQEIDRDVQPGFVVYLPLQKDSQTRGYIYAPFRARNFVEGIFKGEDMNQIGFSITDGLNLETENLLYSDLEEKLGANNSPRFTRTQTIYVAGRPWTISFVSSETYGETSLSQLVPLGVMAVGVGISVLITFIAFTLASSRQRAIAYADEVTEDLQEAKAKDEAMLLGIGEGLVATDADAKIILVNPAFEKLLGWSEGEVMGENFYKIVEVQDEDKKPLLEGERILTKALVSSGNEVLSSRDTYYVRKDGSSFPVAVTVSPITVNGKVEGAVEVFRDITTEKDIDRAKTEFVSLAAHQLRTPLTAINWYAELIAEEEHGLSKPQEEFRTEIVSASKQMTELVSSLLNVSRIELGTFAINPVPANVNEFAQSVLDELKLLIKQKKLELDFYKSEIPEIPLDKGLFRIVYQNLLTNAVKYTPEGGKITIAHEIERDQLLISIADTGYGIPQSEQEKVFEKLYRASNARAKDPHGSGLGLYIVKAIVQESGGEIWFESIENQGTTFFVRLPLSGMEKREGSRMLTTS